MRVNETPLHSLGQAYRQRKAVTEASLNDYILFWPYHGIRKFTQNSILGSGWKILFQLALCATKMWVFKHLWLLILGRLLGINAGCVFNSSVADFVGSSDVVDSICSWEVREQRNAACCFNEFWCQSQVGIQLPIRRRIEAYLHKSVLHQELDGSSWQTWVQ